MIEVLLEKFRENALTREEFEQLAKIMNDPDLEGEVKYWMEEHWEDMDPPGDRSPSENVKSKEQFDELRKKLEDRERDSKI
ncbi:hypothetical protein ED312_14345 [Sinomicrobium pectinilyticum]|uniref:Uncharacterized protein n=1 Tax=Sinomicrobium pectinilyticum TaxID=1084421 RepID=A0A3N0E8K5_SINP1|nr:hypothetical protein ED312_14345 [Sinomicrobium pectinilyticum]